MLFITTLVLYFVVLTIISICYVNIPLTKVMVKIWDNGDIQELQQSLSGQEIRAVRKLNQEVGGKMSLKNVKFPLG